MEMKVFLLLAIFLLTTPTMAACESNETSEVNYSAIEVIDNNTATDTEVATTVTTTENDSGEHWNIAIYIITDLTHTLHRPSYHEDIIDHGLIDRLQLAEIIDRTYRFKDALEIMSNNQMRAELVHYIYDNPINIVTSYDIEFRDIFTDESLYTLIADVNEYDFIMVISAEIFGAAGLYFQTMNNANETHIGLSGVNLEWLRQTYTGTPGWDNYTATVHMFGIEWDFFTYLLLHEFLHGLEEEARRIGVEFPLIHNYEGYAWDKDILEFGPSGECAGVGTGYTCFLWGTSERLPYYYALMNNQVPRREDGNLFWGFTPEVYTRGSRIRRNNES